MTNTVKANIKRINTLRDKIFNRIMNPKTSTKRVAELKMLRVALGNMAFNLKIEELL